MSDISSKITKIRFSWCCYNTTHTHTHTNAHTRARAHTQTSLPDNGNHITFVIGRGNRYIAHTKLSLKTIHVHDILMKRKMLLIHYQTISHLYSNFMISLISKPEPQWKAYFPIRTSVTPNTASRIDIAVSCSRGIGCLYRWCIRYLIRESYS